MSGKTSGLLRAGDSVLAVVDIQDRLAAVMPEDARQRVYRNTRILLESAGLLGLPVLLTEQYPKGLGSTAAPVAELAGEAVRIEKTCFSCGGSSAFLAALTRTHRKQVVLTGMEAHVCVLQTALELNVSGCEVFVVEDAVCSRNPVNRRNAIERMRRRGVTVTSTESAVFEWLRDAGHEHFKSITKLVK